MASVNKVILVGNLGADPETRSTQAGAKIVSFRLATSETWKTKDGERKERTEWHSVVIFNEGLATVAEKYLRKGAKVYIEGQLQTRKWQDQSGQDRYSTEVVLQAYRGELVMLSDPPGGRDDSTRRRSAKPEKAASGAHYPASDLDDDIPFAQEWR